jgi:NAD-dependent SIR2 family protein deacetylase
MVIGCPSSPPLAFSLLLMVVTSVKVLGRMENLERIVSKIKSKEISRVVVLTGAGVSCPSGIPDFRSPGGLYNTLNPSLLTATEKERALLKVEPTAVISYNTFLHNQFLYLEVRRPFILGTAEKVWKPTISHFFWRLLFDKGYLQRLYTQNIDGIDTYVGLPPEKYVHVHGSLATVSCEACRTPYDSEKFLQNVKTQIRNIYDENDPEAPKKSTNITCPVCSKAQVKPDTVLFGRNLPDKFFRYVETDCSNADLVIVAGTSLSVSPANQLPGMVAQGVPKLVVNMDRVGEDMGFDYEKTNGDAILQGDCDAGFLQFAHMLGWLPELVQFKSQMCTASQQALDDALKKASV